MGIDSFRAWASSLGAFWCLSLCLYGIRELSSSEPRVDQTDWVTYSDAQKESIMRGIITLLTPAPIKESCSAWKPLFYHKETAKGKFGDLGALSCVCLA